MTHNGDGLWSKPGKNTKLDDTSMSGDADKGKPV